MGCQLLPTGVFGSRTTLFGLGLIAAGLVHLLAPDRLLRTARWGYDLALDVQFRRGPATTTRVRLVGVGMLLAGAGLLTGVASPTGTESATRES
jgi:hypothetical protein